MPPRPILFDLDGTLVDSIALLVGSMNAAFEGRERRPTDAEWVALIGTPLPTMLRRWAEDDDDVAELTRRYRAWQLAHFDELTQPYPGVPETVAALTDAGHPLALVTSRTIPLAERALTHVGLRRHFAAVIGIERTTHHKPHPEPVHAALTDLGAAEPAHALFVGDSTHDIDAGNAAGVVSVAALWGPYSRAQLAESRPRVWLRNIRDLPSVIGELDRRS